MNNTYNLSTGKIFSIADEYPPIAQGEKIGIMFTGGVESYLVAKLAKEVYGIENVVFVLMAANEYSNFSSNKKKIDKIKVDFYKNVERLGGIHTFEIGNGLYTGHEFAFDVLISELKKVYPTIKIGFAGYSNIHQESINLLLSCDWQRGTITSDDVVEYFHRNKDRYPELKLFIDEMGGYFYFINEVVGFEHVLHHFHQIKRPLKNLTKIEVVELYKQMGFLDELFLTTSCNRSDVEGQCGVCKNCVHRKDAIEKNGLTDLTVYE